jgi:hypothetical protein
LTYPLDFGTANDLNLIQYVKTDTPICHTCLEELWFAGTRENFGRFFEFLSDFSDSGVESGTLKSVIALSLVSYHQTSILIK